MICSCPAYQIEIQLRALTRRRVARSTTRTVHDVVSKRELCLGLQLDLAATHLLHELPLFFCDHRREVGIELIDSFQDNFTLLRLTEHAIVERIAEEACEGRARNGVRVGDLVSLIVFPLDYARAVHLLNPRKNLVKRIAIESHMPHTLHDGEEFWVWIVVAVLIAHVAPLVAALRDGFFEVRPMTARHVHTEAVSIFLGNGEEDTEHHLPCRRVVEVMRVKLQVGDPSFIDQINDHAAFQHVS